MKPISVIIVVYLNEEQFQQNPGMKASVAYKLATAVL